MLTKVEVRTATGATMAFPLRDQSNGFLVKDIEGLDPVKATITSTRFAQLDGTEYQNSRREAREIVLTLGIEPLFGSMTVRDLRSSLYAFLMPKSNVTLRFYIDDTAFADISARVEDFGAPMFSQSPEVKITFMCFNPDFEAPVPVVLNGNTTSSM